MVEELTSVYHLLLNISGYIQTFLLCILTDPPKVRMAPRTPGYYGRTAVLTCEVHSLIPFTLQWMREDGSLMSGDLPYT